MAANHGNNTMSYSPSTASQIEIARFNDVDPNPEHQITLDDTKHTREDVIMLPKLQTIIYACDLDNQTQAAMELVLSLASTNDAKVILMHAMEPLSTQASHMINNYMSEDVRNAMRKDAIDDTTKRMDILLSGMMDKYEKELSALNTPPEKVIANGTPADCVQRLAKEKNADLIVMNSRTHSRLGQMMLGSTANKVIHSSNIPVLVVPLK